MTEQRTGYGDSLEHLLDELSALDCSIRLALAEARPEQGAGPLDQLRGLVLTEAEVSGLLDDAKSTPDSAELEAALTAARESIRGRRAASAEDGVGLRLATLTRLFRLDPLEEHCLVVALAPELDGRYDRLYAFLQDDVTRKRPSVELALRLARTPTRERLAAFDVFSPHARLLRNRLIILESPSEPMPLRARSFKIDDRIVGYLLESRLVDPLLDPAASRSLDGSDEVRASAPPELLARTRAFVREHLERERERSPRALLHVRGRYGSGRHSLAQAAAHELGLSLLALNAERLVHGPPDGLWFAVRESFLGPSVLAIEKFDVLALPEFEAHRLALEDGLRLFGIVTFLIGESAWVPAQSMGDCSFVPIEIGATDEQARAELWQAGAANTAWIDAASADTLAGVFRFTPGQVHDALRDARDVALWRSPATPEVTEADVYAACRRQSSLPIDGLAHRVDPRYGWDDIVLPDEVLLELRDLCARARHRKVVLGEWGFGAKHATGHGTSVLFSGPPGTGKTMAAQVLARDLQLDLYKIDLSQVVNKYIGETEKNLERVFQSADAANAILFFDEADALFGKRSEVRDAHDRYANLEVSYLLQKMEEYEGIAILATNLRNNLDSAFQRRLQAIVEFPFPEVSDRRRIWGVTFPPAMPLAEPIDFDTLAQQIRLAGANIRSIAVAAAYLAAADGGALRMSHLYRAAEREYQKIDQTWSAPCRTPEVVR